jgi:hypothetical protein
MAGTQPSVGRRRASRPARIAGYVVAVLVNLAMWLLVYVWPGWEVVPFLSDEVPRVLGLFSLSVFANLAYDPRWFRAAGEVVISVIGLALAWRVLVVFPFDFTGLGYDLTTLARVVVVLGVIGSAIGVLVNLASFGREVLRAAEAR